MRWILIILLIKAVVYAKPLELSVNAEAAVLMNATTGRVLFGKNQDQPAYPASTTKIATALLALQRSPKNLEMIITAERESIASITPQAKKQSNYRSPPHWLETDGTHAGIKRGEQLRLYDLLHLMMVGSANDASNVIAQGLGGSIPKFMEEINDYLKKIGCKNTHFNNPHGLHHPEHVTTAYDLALMTKEALKDPLFRQIVSSVRFTCPQTNLEEERHLVQTNQLLKKGSFYYAKAIGVKTGFTQSAGKNLVAAAQDKDRLLIAVALGYKGPRSELYQDITKMFEAAFNEQKVRHTLLPKGEQKMTAQVIGAKKPLKTYLTESLYYDVYPSEITPVKVSMSWQIPPLPIAQGVRVGSVKVLDERGTLLAQASLLAQEELAPTLWHKFKHCFSFQSLGKKSAFVLALALLLLIFVRFRKKKMR